eukprot:TRINITY_DN20677_c0_g1_i1.p1 TRINITY_DN20677_c0_g1~~TRINITY_DN20677_c0_g1_i1.p1  ORF type:complete len:585 (+),score=119.52 TRINITY_DN20677_c0_g1_i1:44-1798(+)
MRVPIDLLCPRVFRWLSVLGLDHLIEFKSWIRVMLMLSCLISLYFCITWLLDVAQLACFAYTPWSDVGYSKHSCLMHLCGGIVMFFMFQTSGTVLAYYDEDGEQLWEKKNRTLSELSKQTSEVLLRATGQAKRLCGMLNADLGDKVREHVFRMRKILEMVQRERSSNAAQVYKDLVTEMAIHLHRLRQPAIEHFSKLVALSDRSACLYSELRSMKTQSMVELLTDTDGSSRPVPRTETLAIEDVESGLAALFGSSPASAIASYIPSLTAVGSLAMCMSPEDPDDLEEGTNLVDERMRLPDENDLHDELLPITAELRRAQPEKVVLRPLRLVLTWFEKVGSNPGGAAGPSADVQGFGARDQLRARTSQASYNPLDQLMAVLRHIRRSPFYRQILIGICFSAFFLAFDVHMLLVVIGVMREGRCAGGLVIQCGSAVFRQVLNVAAMVCYMVSLTVVLWNVERLDNVLKVQEEIQQLEDFKRQIDLLNAHDFQDEDTSISMIQTVETQLAEQKRIISYFFNDAWGQEIAVHRYQQLVEDLREVLAPPKTASPAARPRALSSDAQRRLERRDANDEEVGPLLGGADSR